MKQLAWLILLLAPLCQGAVNSLKIADNTGAGQSNRPVGFEREFACGEIANFPQPQVDGTTRTGSTWQANVHQRCADGSVKSAFIALIVPSLPAAGPATRITAATPHVTITFVNNASTGNQATGVLKPSDMLAAAYNFDQTITLTGTAVATVSARQMLQDALAQNDSCSAIYDFSQKCRYWVTGPVVTGVVLEDRTGTRLYDQNTDGTAIKPLHPIVEAYFFPSTHTVLADPTVENAWATSTTGGIVNDQTYSLDVKTGIGATASCFSNASFTHIGWSRWHFGGNPFKPECSAGPSFGAILIDHNTLYLSSTGAIPNYIPGLDVDESLLALTYQKFTNSGTNNGPVEGYYAGGNVGCGSAGNGNCVGNMMVYATAGGVHEWMGLLANWTTQYALTWDDRMKTMVDSNADLLARIPWHFREADASAGNGHAFDAPENCGLGGAAACPASETGHISTQGRIVSINARQQAKMYPTATDLATTCTGNANDIIKAGTFTTGGWTGGNTGLDNSHHPMSDAYLAYLTEGKYYQLEEVEFIGDYMVGAAAGCWVNPSTVVTSVPSPPPRNGAAGFVRTDQPRSIAFSLYNLGRAAFVAPNVDQNSPGSLASGVAASAERDYFDRKIKNNISILEGAHQLTQTYTDQTAYTTYYNYGKNQVASSYAGFWMGYGDYTNLGPSPAGHWNVGDNTIADNLKTNGTIIREQVPYHINYVYTGLGLLGDYGYSVDNLLQYGAKRYLNLVMNYSLFGGPYFPGIFREATVMAGKQWATFQDIYNSTLIPPRCFPGYGTQSPTACAQVQGQTFPSTSCGQTPTPCVGAMAESRDFTAMTALTFMCDHVSSVDGYKCWDAYRTMLNQVPNRMYLNKTFGSDCNNSSLPCGPVWATIMPRTKEASGTFPWLTGGAATVGVHSLGNPSYTWATTYGGTPGASNCGTVGGDNACAYKNTSLVYSPPDAGSGSYPGNKNQCPVDGFQGSSLAALTSGNSNYYDFTTSCRSMFDAQSGGWYDPYRHKLYLMGGGHGDYAGNQIMGVDLTETSPSMKRVKDPVFPLSLKNNSSNIDLTFSGFKYEPNAQPEDTNHPSFAVSVSGNGTAVTVTCSATCASANPSNTYFNPLPASITPDGKIYVTISGTTNYNGTFLVNGYVSPTSFTYSSAVNAGAHSGTATATNSNCLPDAQGKGCAPVSRHTTQLCTVINGTSNTGVVDHSLDTAVCASGALGHGHGTAGDSTKDTWLLPLGNGVSKNATADWVLANLVPGFTIAAGGVPQLPNFGGALVYEPVSRLTFALDEMTGNLFAFDFFGDNGVSPRTTNTWYKAGSGFPVDNDYKSVAIWRDLAHDSHSWLIAAGGCRSFPIGAISQSGTTVTITMANSGTINSNWWSAAYGTKAYIHGVTDATYNVGDGTHDYTVVQSVSGGTMTVLAPANGHGSSSGGYVVSCDSFSGSHDNQGVSAVDVSDVSKVKAGTLSMTNARWNDNTLAHTNLDLARPELGNTCAEFLAGGQNPLWGQGVPYNGFLQNPGFVLDTSTGDADSNSIMGWPQEGLSFYRIFPDPANRRLTCRRDDYTAQDANAAWGTTWVSGNQMSNYSNTNWGNYPGGRFFYDPAADIFGILMSADQGVKYLVPQRNVAYTQAPSGPVTHQVSATIVGTGSVDSSPAGLNCASGTCAYSFPEGTTVTLTAHVSGTIFSGWSGACSGASPTCVLSSLNADQSVTATFVASPPATSGTSYSGQTLKGQIIH